MKTLSKKTPNRRTALVQAYEREGSHGGDWELVYFDACTEEYECVIDYWDIWDDCTPPATKTSDKC